MKDFEQEKLSSFKEYSYIRSIVACGILCELGGLRRFDSLKHLAGYIWHNLMVYESGYNVCATSVTCLSPRLI